MPTRKIKVIPTSYQEVMALLNSDALHAVEDSVAPQVGLSIIRDYSTSSTQDTQAEISVSGMTANEIEKFLANNREMLVAFGVRFLTDQEATKDEEEFPDGEEQDEDGESRVLGIGSGFGIKLAIYLNFLANRTPAEFRDYLQNRRIPHHAKLAMELRRVFESTPPPAGSTSGPPVE
jgi:hypothetical protein